MINMKQQDRLRRADRQGLNISRGIQSHLVSREVMDIKREAKKRQEPQSDNEWLRIVESLDKLMARHASEESTRMTKRLIGAETLAAMNIAYAATLRYYKTLLEGGKCDRGEQRRISRLWHKAGKGIRRLDPFLADRLKSGNTFWSNQLTWREDSIQETWARLNSIRISANILAPNDEDSHGWSPFSSS
jgi:hypothetical protein